MAMAEQPLKKRKLYEPPLEPPPPPPPPPPSQEPPPPPPPPSPQPPVQPSSGPAPLSRDEILRRQRNREEIRSLHDSYKRIKFCVSKKDDSLMADFEQAYLSLITASRGCTSVQRIVADLIPRYASYCPTALEAAAKVVINMHNWSLSVISRGEDADGVAFETAKACIIGLVDICYTASLEAPTSSVIQGICSAVFLNVLTFFISSFEGKDIFEIVDKEVLKMLDFAELFSELKKKFTDENNSVLFRLTKLRALCLLRIFFSCPKDLLAACFELFDSTTVDGVHKRGHYFLCQVTRRLDVDDYDHSLDAENDGIKSSAPSMETRSKCMEVIGDRLASNGNYFLKNCLLGQVLGKDASLRSWIFSEYKKFCSSASPQILSETTSCLERVFGSLVEQVNSEENEPESSKDNLHPTEFANRLYEVPRTCNQHENSHEVSVRDHSSRTHGQSHAEDLAKKFSGQYSKHCSSVVPLETDVTSTSSSNLDSGGSKSAEFDTGEHGHLSYSGSSTPRDPSNSQLLSPALRKSSNLRSHSFEGRSHFVHTERQVLHMEQSMASLRSTGGTASPRHHLPLPYSQPSPMIWYSDGDLEAMDICSASNQLWVGCLGPEASEALVRFQFEKFGPIDQFLYFPPKGFALFEYKSILDAVKAREAMRGHSPWGACLCVKFLDIGVGTRGAIKGVAVGSSCHVYIGNVTNQWAKDEILHEIRKIVYKGPRLVTELTTPGSLLLEFVTPEEAAAVLGHLRRHRKENSSNSNAKGMMHIDGAVGPSSTHVDLRSSNSGSNVVKSPHPQPLLEDPIDSYRTSHPGKQQATFTVNPESNPLELASPRTNLENNVNTTQGGLAFQSNWPPTGTTEIGARKADSYDSKTVTNHIPGGCQFASGAVEQMWMYRKPEIEMQSAPGSIPHLPTMAQGQAVAPPPLMQASPFMRPVYLPPNSSWDGRNLNHHVPLNPITPVGLPNSLHCNSVAPPFLPASVTPLAQIQGSSMSQFDQMYPHPANKPPVTPLPPLQPDMQRPLPPQPDLPPPLPHHSLLPPLPPQPALPPPLPPSPPPPPPLVPPPPMSPPSSLPVESSYSKSSVQSLNVHWLGTLCKSGVHYCSVYANRVESDICKYSGAVSEPAGWPAKLDMTKRTDFRHVKSTFSSSPPHKREVCQLLPSSASDHKGFQDFISYLKQRDCAGVIKIPALKSMWTRLLFILPYSSDICSLLSIAPSSPDCLIALILPKETNFEWE